jgi:tetratricopeptide (TPR) repeat protein
LLELWDALSGRFEDLLINDFHAGYHLLVYSDYLLIGLLAVAVAVPALVIWLWLRRRGRSHPLGRPASPREARSAARRALKSGNFARAGELYEQAGAFPKAVDTYLKGRAITRAAQVYAKKLNQPEKAIELLLLNHIFEPAAQLLSSLDRCPEAGKYLLQAGKEQMAAEMFEKGGDFVRAGDLFLKSRRLVEAGRCYTQGHAWAQAGEVYDRMFVEYSQAPESTSSDKTLEGIRDLGKKAAYSLKQAGNPKRAAEILLAAQLPQYAAELFILAGDEARAAELYLESQDFKRAAELFAKAGNKKRAAGVMAQFHQAEGRPQEAARFLEMAEEHLAAADLYAHLGEYERAAGLYLQGGDSRTASEMYLAAGTPEKAVKIFEQQGDVDAAIRMCEETGNYAALAGLYLRRRKFFEAAQVLIDQGQKAEAEEALMQVGPDNPRYGEAQARLGSLLLDRGENKDALERLQNMASRIMLGPATMDYFYLLALAYEANAFFPYAATIYQQLATLNYHYKDVVMRYNALPQKMAAEAKKHPGRIVLREGAVIAERFVLKSKLGEGGMGVVWLCEDRNLERPVAIKVLPENLKDHPEMIKSLVSEATNLAKVSHPNIVTVYDAAMTGDFIYIVMEYVPGQTLKDMIVGKDPKAPPRPIAVAGTLKVFHQVCEALAYAHNLKLIHRDIKPANIIWSTAKFAKVMDFGLAQMMDRARAGRTGVAGTPYYMSPEQTLGRAVDHRTDIYSLGVCVFELLTGRVPFPEGDIGYHHLNTPPPQPRSLNPQVPEELERIVLKCMEKDRERRYQTVAELLDDLHKLSA